MEEMNIKLAIKLAIINLRYDMNKNTIHKMNLVMVCIQFIMLFVGMILQITMRERASGIAIMNALWSLVIVILVVINGEVISPKAMKRAKEQADAIETLLDKLSDNKDRERFVDILLDKLNESEKKDENQK